MSGARSIPVDTVIFESTADIFITSLLNQIRIIKEEVEIFESLEISDAEKRAYLKIMDEFLLIHEESKKLLPLFQFDDIAMAVDLEIAKYELYLRSVAEFKQKYRLNDKILLTDPAIIQLLNTPDECKFYIALGDALKKAIKIIADLIEQWDDKKAIPEEAFKLAYALKLACEIRPRTIKLLENAYRLQHQCKNKPEYIAANFHDTIIKGLITTLDTDLIEQWVSYTNPNESLPSEYYTNTLNETSKMADKFYEGEEEVTRIVKSIDMFAHLYEAHLRSSITNCQQQANQSTTKSPYSPGSSTSFAPSVVIPINKENPAQSVSYQKG